MPYTNCKVHMEFVDTSAIEDGTLVSESNAEIGNLELFKEDNIVPSYAVPDWNAFLLDGSRTIMPNDVEVPFISVIVSDDNCGFVDNPVLEISFSEEHTSAGITLSFVDDYPAEIQVYWYDLSGPLLISKTFYPDKLKFFCRNQVSSYGKIKVEFIRTNLPGQRIQCRYIKYGTEIDWTSEEIKAATLNEEVDVTGATIPINTAEISIIDTENDFELTNRDGIWKSIQKRQKLTIVEEVGTNEVTCGVLYIDTWKSTDNIVKFSLIDKIGVIDKTTFYGGQIYIDELAGNIIDSIMASAGVDDYTVSAEVREILLSGHIPICSHRAALQQVIFACGAVAACSRTGSIQIYLPDRYADTTIGPERKFMGTTLEMDDYVSGVEVAYKKYRLGNDTVNIYDDVLSAGDNLIAFSEPYDNVSVSAGTILGVSTNWVRVRMEESRTCVITGKKYESTEIKYTASVDRIEAGEEENVISYGGCTLVNAARAREVAERILNYYQLRQIVSMRYLIDSEKVGDWVNIADVYGNIVTSGIISHSIDLVGGYIATATCRGYSTLTVDHAYIGEIYAGERGII